MKQRIAYMSIILACFWAQSVSGQKTYQEAILLGDRALQAQQFEKAINYYFAAEAFDPLKKATIKQKVKMVFNHIEEVNQQAQQQAKTIQANTLNALAASYLNDAKYNKAIRTANEAHGTVPNIESERVVARAYQEIIRTDTPWNISDFQAHEAAVYHIEIAANNAFFLTIAENNTLKLWTLEGEQLGETIRLERSIVFTAIAPDASSFVVVLDNETVMLFDAQTTSLIKELDILVFDETCHFQYAFSGDYLLYTNRTERLAALTRIWNKKGEIIHDGFSFALYRKLNFYKKTFKIDHFSSV